MKVRDGVGKGHSFGVMMGRNWLVWANVEKRLLNGFINEPLWR